MYISQHKDIHVNIHVCVHACTHIHYTLFIVEIGRADSGVHIQVCRHVSKQAGNGYNIPTMIHDIVYSTKSYMYFAYANKTW